MRHFNPFFTLAALLLSGTLLSSCGGGSDTKTSTPSSTLGTDSAATQVGGMPDSTGGRGTTLSGSGPGSTGTSGAGTTMGGAGHPAAGGTGASGTTNGTGAN